MFETMLARIELFRERSSVLRVGKFISPRGISGISMYNKILKNEEEKEFLYF